MCKVYTDLGGIKELYHVCPPVRKIIHSLKLVDYLQVQADSTWYNYYIMFYAEIIWMIYSRIVLVLIYLLVLEIKVGRLSSVNKSNV